MKPINESVQHVLEELGVVDAPSGLTLYHGTETDLSSFSMDGVGGAHGMGFGWGLYLTDDLKTARVYAGAECTVYQTTVPAGPWMIWVGRIKDPQIKEAMEKVFSSLRSVSRYGEDQGQDYYDHFASKDFALAGGRFYGAAADLLDDHVGKETSALFRKHGVIGITYDQGIIRLKDGSVSSPGVTNYVLFDAKDASKPVRVEQ